MRCAFKGCGKSAFSRGYCRGHYGQWWRDEELRALQIQHHGLTEYDRFLKRVKVKKAADCWDWSGSRNKTHWHGQWRNGAGQIELAHRAAWRLLKGEIPGDLFVLHKCDNPICCNPTHLFLGTQSDNLTDMWKKDRAKPGVSRGEKHGMSKLNEGLVRMIRSSKESGVSLANRLKLSPTTICDIRKRRIWKHIE